MVPQTVLGPGRFHAHRTARRPGRNGRNAQRQPCGCAIGFNAITGTYYTINGTAFGLWENGQATRMGVEGALRQSLEDGYLPIVLTLWRHGDLDIRQRATAEPLRGTSYQTGLESTLARAEFDITNSGKQTREITFFAAQTGDNETSPAGDQLS